MLVDPKPTKKLLLTNPKPQEEMLKPETKGLVGKPKPQKWMLVDPKPAKKLLPSLGRRCKNPEQRRNGWKNRNPKKKMLLDPQPVRGCYWQTPKPQKEMLKP